MSTQARELLACPRCGSGAFLTLDNAVWCRTDMCLKLPPRPSAEEATEAWNTRSLSCPAIAEDDGKLIRIRQFIEDEEPFGYRYAADIEDFKQDVRSLIETLSSSALTTRVKELEAECKLLGSAMDKLRLNTSEEIQGYLGRISELREQALTTRDEALEEAVQAVLGVVYEEDGEQMLNDAVKAIRALKSKEPTPSGDIEEAITALKWIPEAYDNPTMSLENFRRGATQMANLALSKLTKEP